MKEHKTQEEFQERYQRLPEKVQHYATIVLIADSPRLKEKTREHLYKAQSELAFEISHSPVDLAEWVTFSHFLQSKLEDARVNRTANGRSMIDEVQRDIDMRG